MDNDNVFSLSRRGEAHLQDAGTTLAPEDLALLVRFDGSLSWGEVRATLPPSTREEAPRRIASLLVRGLLERVEPDPLGLRLRFDTRVLAAAAGEAPPRDGLASLRRRGFRAGIALKRAARRAQELPVNVVLVEDDPMLAHFIQTFLTLEGFNVRTAGHRAEIVETIRRPPRPDLFLLDIDLPDTDGFAVLRGVRRHPVLCDVPCIMLTGTGTRESVIRGLGEGADGYITKPFDPDTLVRAVHSVLGAEDAPTPGLHDFWGNRDAMEHRAV